MLAATLVITINTIKNSYKFVIWKPTMEGNSTGVGFAGSGVGGIKALNVPANLLAAGLNGNFGLILLKISITIFSKVLVFIIILYIIVLIYNLLYNVKLSTFYYSNYKFNMIKFIKNNLYSLYYIVKWQHNI